MRADSDFEFYFLCFDMTFPVDWALKINDLSICEICRKQWIWVWLALYFLFLQCETCKQTMNLRMLFYYLITWFGIFSYVKCVTYELWIRMLFFASTSFCPMFSNPQWCNVYFQLWIRIFTCGKMKKKNQNTQD